MANPPSIVRRARIAASAAFFLDGFTFANWVTRIPAVQEQLHLRNATLGVALLMTSLGALLTMPIIGRLIARHGSRLVTTLAVGGFGASLVLPGLAGGSVSLAAALFVFGCGFGAVNVAINSQAVSVERRYRIPIMGSFHATFSFGGIAGAAAGSLAAAAHLSPLIHFILAGVAVTAAAMLLGRYLIPDESGTARDAPRGQKIASGLLLLGTIAFCTMLGEGAMADWSAVFLRQVSGANPSIAALGFGAFSLAMTLGRLAADKVTVKLGPAHVVRLGGTLAASGLMLAMLLPGTATAIGGFTLVGAGLSALVPTIFSAAGRTPGIAASVAIATVSTTGYFGFLCGPPLIGAASEVMSLRWAMVFVFAAACVAITLARYAGVQPGSGGRTDYGRTDGPAAPCLAGRLARDVAPARA
jgi:MFS family permease